MWRLATCNGVRMLRHGGGAALLASLIWHDVGLVSPGGADVILWDSPQFCLCYKCYAIYRISSARTFSSGKTAVILGPDWAEIWGHTKRYSVPKKMQPWKAFFWAHMQPCRWRGQGTGQRSPMAFSKNPIFSSPCRVCRLSTAPARSRSLSHHSGMASTVPTVWNSHAFAHERVNLTK
jgi:hypothetical protein